MRLLRVKFNIAAGQRSVGFFRNHGKLTVRFDKSAVNLINIAVSRKPQLFENIVNAYSERAERNRNEFAFRDNLRRVACYKAAELFAFQNAY